MVEYYVYRITVSKDKTIDEVASKWGSFVRRAGHLFLTKLMERLYKSFYGKNEKELKRKIKEYNEDMAKYTVKVETTFFHDLAEFCIRTVNYPILKPVSYECFEQTHNVI